MFYDYLIGINVNRTSIQMNRPIGLSVHSNINGMYVAMNTCPSHRKPWIDYN